jgi:hypothetical protein
LLVALPAVAGTNLAAALAQDEEFVDASGFDSLRIEQEDKLFVPDDIAMDVWAFLQQRFVADKAFLVSLDPALTSFASEEHFRDTYYDTPSMQMAAMQSCVRHRRRVNLTNEADRKNNRELMQIKLNHISDNALERGEIKFEVEYPAVVSSAEDSHPMFGIVKPSHRGLLRKRLVDIGLEPDTMKPVVTIDDIRRRVYIYKNGSPFISISHDSGTSGMWWARARFCEIEPELNEIQFTNANAEGRAYMESILKTIVSEIRGKFPAITQNLTPKYNKVFERVESQVPFARTLVRAGMQGTEGMLVFVGVVAVVAFVVYRLVRDRMRRSKPPAPAGVAPTRA